MFVSRPFREFCNLQNIGSTLRPLFISAIPLCALSFTVILLFFRHPIMLEKQFERIKFPSNMSDLKLLGRTLLEYKGFYYWRILFILMAVYILLQSFMIPGSVFCSVLLGYLFPIPLALFVIALCSAVGASCCYIIFNFIGSQTLLKLYPDRIAACQKLMSRFKNTMYFTIFLFRLSPVIPNWLINISSPILGVPLLDFFMGTFIGVIPLSLFFVKAGTMLQELTDVGITSVTSVYTLVLFAVISTVPIIFQSQFRNFLSG